MAVLGAAPMLGPLELAGPGRYCSPRHRMLFNSRNEGSKGVGGRGEQSARPWEVAATEPMLFWSACFRSKEAFKLLASAAEAARPGKGVIENTHSTDVVFRRTESARPLYV